MKKFTIYVQRQVWEEVEAESVSDAHAKAESIIDEENKGETYDDCFHSRWKNKKNKSRNSTPLSPAAASGVTNV